MVLTIPHEHATSTILGIKDRPKSGQIVVSPVVPMVKVNRGMLYSPIIEGNKLQTMIRGY